MTRSAKNPVLVPVNFGPVNGDMGYYPYSGLAGSSDSDSPGSNLTTYPFEVFFYGNCITSVTSDIT